MEEKIRRLYLNELENNGIDKMSKNTEKQVLELIKDKQNLNFKDLLFQAASIGEEEGFVCGFRYAIQLLMECL